MPSVYKINDGENIFDVVLATYGSLELTYKLIEDNPELTSIDLDLLVNYGFSVSFDETLTIPDEDKQSTLPLLVTKKPEYIIQEGQSLYDLAIMVYGNVEKVFQLIQDNILKIDNINQNVLAGINLNYNSDLIDDKVLTDYLLKYNLVINTSDPKINSGSGFTIGFVTDSFY